MEEVARIKVERHRIEGEDCPEEVSLKAEYRLYAHIIVREERLLPGSEIFIRVKRVRYEVHERAEGSPYVAIFEGLSLPALSEAFEELAKPALEHYLRCG